MISICFEIVFEGVDFNSFNYYMQMVIKIIGNEDGMGLLQVLLFKSGNAEFARYLC